MNLPQVELFGIEGVVLVTPKRFRDARGFFSELYNLAAFREVGVSAEFVQDNHSLSELPGTLRGLHFQSPPFAQAKLVRVSRGRIFDAVVDIRRASPTFGQSLTVELSAEDGRQLFLPRGFAHGFCTLEPQTEVVYKVDAPYSAEHERGLNWSDPALGISWPMADGEAHLIERDKQWPSLRELPSYF
jgi:dTDP-4-dehydrorhamnose 3,5-epimerase